MQQRHLKNDTFLTLHRTVLKGDIIIVYSIPDLKKAEAGNYGHKKKTHLNVLH